MIRRGAVDLLQSQDAGVVSYTVRYRLRKPITATCRVDSRRVDTITALRALGVKVRPTRVDYTHPRRDLPIVSEHPGYLIRGVKA